MAMIDLLTVGLFLVGAIWIVVVLLMYRNEIKSKGAAVISTFSGLSESESEYIGVDRRQRIGYAEPVLLVFALAILSVVGVRAYSPDTLVPTGTVEAKLTSGYVVEDQKVGKNQFEDALSKIKEQPDLVSYLRLEDVNFSDLNEIAHLQDLNSLNLDGTLVEDLEPIRKLQGLRALDLGKTPFYNTHQLEYFPNLEWLDVSETKLYDFAPLDKLTNLKQLELRGLEIQDLSPLRDLRNLRKLDISRTKAADLRPLENLTKLEELRLNSTNVNNLESLYGLSSLKVLDISAIKVHDLEPLHKLTSLKTLDLSETSIDPVQIERLRQRLAEGGNTGLEVRVSPGWGAKAEPIS